MAARRWTILDELRMYYDDYRWLNAHLGEIKEFIEGNFWRTNDHYKSQAIEALLLVYEYTRLRHEVEPWTGLLGEAFSQAQQLNDARLAMLVREMLIGVHTARGEIRIAKLYIEAMDEDSSIKEYKTDPYVTLPIYLSMLELLTLRPNPNLLPELCQQVLELLEIIDDEVLEARAYQALGAAHIHHGQYELGIEESCNAFDRYLDITPLNPIQMIRTALTIGEACRKMGYLTEALYYYDVAEAYLLEYEIDSHRLSGLLYSARGLSHFNAYDHAKAREALQQALDHFMLYGEKYFIALGQHTLGLAQAWSDHLDEAEENFNLALPYWIANDHLYMQAEALYALGHIKDAQQKPLEALRHCLSAKQLCRDNPDYPLMQNTLALVEAKLRDIEKKTDLSV